MMDQKNISFFSNWTIFLFLSRVNFNLVMRAPLFFFNHNFFCSQQESINRSLSSIWWCCQFCLSYLRDFLGVGDTGVFSNILQKVDTKIVCFSSWR
jgi:hypothetical protein